MSGDAIKGPGQWRVVSTNPPEGLRRVGIQRLVDNAGGCRLCIPVGRIPEAFWMQLALQLMKMGVISEMAYPLPATMRPSAAKPSAAKPSATKPSATRPADD